MSLEEVDKYAQHVLERKFQTELRRTKIQLFGDYVELTYMFPDSALTERIPR